MEKNSTELEKLVTTSKNEDGKIVTTVREGATVDELVEFISTNYNNAMIDRVQLHNEKNKFLQVSQKIILKVIENDFTKIDIDASKIMMLVTKVPQIMLIKNPTIIIEKVSAMFNEIGVKLPIKEIANLSIEDISIIKNYYSNERK